MPTIPQLQQQRQQAFQQADQSGDAITPQQWGHVVGLMQNAMRNVDPQQNPKTAQIVQALTARLAGNQPMSFQEMDSIREALAQSGEPVASRLVGLIDQALESMGATNPNMKGAIQATQGIQVRTGLMQILQQALSYKQAYGIDMLTAMQKAMYANGAALAGLPPADRQVLQNMVMTGDTSKFSALLNQDAGGQNGQYTSGPVDQRVR